MVAPALSSIAAEFNIINEVESQVVLSSFVLAYALGYVSISMFHLQPVPVQTTIFLGVVISKGFQMMGNEHRPGVLTLWPCSPLLLGPLSEIYGRVPVVQLANLFYLIFNIACGASRNKGEMIAFRFLSGLGGSAPLAVRIPLSSILDFIR